MDFKTIKGGLLVPDLAIVVGGRFIGQIIRDGAVIDEFEDRNLVVNEGLNYLLNTGLAGQGQLTNWYIGLFAGNYTPQASANAAGITAAATEWTQYGEGARQPYIAPPTTTGALTNSASQAVFTNTAAGTIYGAFVASASAKGATTGVLFAAAAFASPKTVGAGDLLVLNYVLGATSA